MAVLSASVFGVLNNSLQAHKVVSRLTSAGFSNSDISLLSLSVNGLLATIGIPDFMIHRYERWVQAGSLLVLVRCVNSLEIDRAISILEENGAGDVFSNNEPVAGRFGS